MMLTMWLKSGNPSQVKVIFPSWKQWRNSQTTIGRNDVSQGTPVFYQNYYILINRIKQKIKNFAGETKIMSLFFLWNISRQNVRHKIWAPK